MQTVKFRNLTLTVHHTTYADPQNPCLQLLDEDGGPYAIASVNVDQVLLPGMVAIKTWSENAGLYEALVDAKIISPKIAEIPCGFVSAAVCQLIT
ncbi:hypothetical protein [Aggregatilinea lenta]|uniref:hypothetical protein n=1 Tax=Aggregatilinea lenta TaxID=913108 RepID=UPI000E5B80BC|nr:hypothetical protein [Aggregatilinea lenta]